MISGYLRPALLIAYWAHPAYVCTGLCSPRLRLHRDWARPAHICTGTGLIPPTSAPRLGPPRPHLHRGSCAPGTSVSSMSSQTRRSSLHRRSARREPSSRSAVPPSAASVGSFRSAYSSAARVGSQVLACSSMPPSTVESWGVGAAARSAHPRRVELGVALDDCADLLAKYPPCTS
jgi:hypothetical protein